ncbi:MAG: hypothetical protein VX017_11250, partial [Pseudomonadota bacterium]|nr:hypothetical protein [Pseudomonadota bacterium]
MYSVACDRLLGKRVLLGAQPVQLLLELRATHAPPSYSAKAHRALEGTADDLARQLHRLQPASAAYAEAAAQRATTRLAGVRVAVANEAQASLLSISKGGGEGDAAAAQARRAYARAETLLARSDALTRVGAALEG